MTKELNRMLGEAIVEREKRAGGGNEYVYWLARAAQPTTPAAPTSDTAPDDAAPTLVSVGLVEKSLDPNARVIDVAQIIEGLRADVERLTAERDAAQLKADTWRANAAALEARIDELTNDSSASVKIVRDLLDVIEPQQDGDLLRPIARWVYNAVRVNLDLLHGICSEFGCPQGEDVATWLRARLAGVPAPCMCSGAGPCEKRTDDSCRRDRAAALAPAAEPVPRKTGYVLVPVEPTQAMLDRGYWPCTQGRGAKSVWGEMLRAIPAAPQPPAPAAARERLTESDVFTLIGHAGLLRGCGETDMPAWCLGLAHRIAVGIDASLALRVEALKEQDAAHPAQPEPRASSGVISAALAVIEADRAQALTTDHIDALDNSIKIQRGELNLPEPHAEVTDTARLDWLCERVVNVRHPLLYGSRDMFWASPTDDDSGHSPSDLRAQIDAARAGEKQ
ncbi:hypothetical protein [Burkholderia vietnamiensis]|uniref:hypothetical protein n=1 Tax=Burkholderia vietnamiensis TaxID=60552 RepID=UPI001E408447|nr:hypothetical protein [Burkholderia vietnamiensis]